MIDDSSPMPLDHEKHRRQLVRFLPDISTGNILQILVLTVGGVAAYGQYTQDQAKRDMRIEQVRTDLELSRGTIKESILELRTDVKEMQHTLNDVSQNVAVLKSSDQANQAKQTGPRAK